MWYFPDFVANISTKSSGLISTSLSRFGPFSAISRSLEYSFRISFAKRVKNFKAETLDFKATWPQSRTFSTLCTTYHFSLPMHGCMRRCCKKWRMCRQCKALQVIDWRKSREFWVSEEPQETWNLPNIQWFRLITWWDLQSTISMPKSPGKDGNRLIFSYIENGNKILPYQTYIFYVDR